MGFPSRFNGTCIKCLQSISVGEEITWNRLERQKVWHMNCDDRNPNNSAKLNGVAPVVSIPAPTLVAAIEENTKTINGAPVVHRAERAAHGSPLDAFIDALMPLIQERLAESLSEEKVIELIRKHAPAALAREFKRMSEEI